MMVKWYKFFDELSNDVRLCSHDKRSTEISLSHANNLPNFIVNSRRCSHAEAVSPFHGQLHHLPQNLKLD